MTSLRSPIKTSTFRAHKLFSRAVISIAIGITVLPSISAFAQDDTNIQSMTISAVESFEQSDYKKAAQLFNQQLKQNIDIAKSQYYLGRIALINNKFDQAGDYLEKAISQKKDADYHYWLGVVNAEQAQRASIFSMASYAKRAKKHFEQSVQIDPTHLKGLNALVSYYLQAPSIVGGSEEKAMITAKKIEEISPISGALAKLKVLSNTGETKQKAQYISEIESTLQDSADIMLQVGFHHQREKAYIKAHQAFLQAQKGMTIQPKDTDTHLNALYQIGKTAVLANQNHDEAITALQKYISQDTSDRIPPKNWAKFRLATLFSLKGNTEEAKVILTELSKKKLEDDLHSPVKKALKKLG